MSKFIDNLTRNFKKVEFKAKKYSPEILVVAGIGGVVASTIMACKATSNVQAVLNEAKGTIDNIHAIAERTDESDGAVYDQKDINKALTITYANTAMSLIKLYGPAVLLGAASVTCIISSHNILKKRNIALAAAYTAVDKGFKEYRGRVIERFGKELDHELRHNVVTKEFDKKVIDEKTGEEKIEKELVSVVEDPNEYSDFARFFDESCRGWSKDPEQNLTFLKAQQSYANLKLKSQGYLFLNDVYDSIGIPRSKAGFVVGWMYDEKNPIGDNYVDFGIYDANRERVRDFVNGYERTILLDFNVDGDIISMM